ncbi:lipopolysaccharide biosynthesis protein [Herbiconiux sp. UC225_62]|uniref:lipopolysaccharide biosynthesis protein n=1 Tax=Herbiconiux sp. UC225_62 TaxID=3350168 RepID=UPI0036D345A0
MSLASTAARGAAASLSSQFIKFLVNLLSISVLARLLSPGDYGTVAMVTAITSVAFILSDFGLSMASIQSQTITRPQKTNLFWLNAALGVVLSAIVFICAVPISVLYGNADLVQVTQVISILFLLSSLTAQFRAEATSKLKFNAMAIVDVASPAVAFVVALFIALGGYGYWALVLQQVVQVFVQLVLLVVIARWWPGLPRRHQQMKSLLSFGVNSVGVQLVNYVSNNIDSVLIGRFSGSEALGFYSRAYQLFRLPLQQLAAPTTRVAFPILSRLNGTPEYDRYIQRAQLVLTYVLGGVFFAAAGAAAPLIEIALGPGWDQTKLLFAILCVGGVFQSLGYVYYWLFLSKAMTGLQLRYALISRSIMVGLVACGVIWGPVGVATGMSTGLFLNWLILTIFAVPKTGVAVKPLVLAAVRPMLLFVGMLIFASPVIYLSSAWPAWGSLGAIAAAMAVYLGIAFLVSRAVRRDVFSIVEVVRKIRR